MPVCRVAEESPIPRYYVSAEPSKAEYRIVANSTAADDAGDKSEAQQWSTVMEGSSWIHN